MTVTVATEDIEQTPRHDPSPLERYRPGDFFFATRERSILGRGVASSVTDTDPVRLSERVADTLSEQPTRMAVGALPFDTGANTRTPGRMVVPDTVHIGGFTRAEAGMAGAGRLGEPLAVRAVPEPEEHADIVAHAIDELDRRRMRKVVLARALDLEFALPVDTALLLRNLISDNPDCHTFAVEAPASATLLGATPELLVSRRGNQVISHPQAGSAPRSSDPTVDAQHARELAGSTKDHAEHDVLTESVIETLRPFCRTLRVPSGPSVVGTSTMWHLGTRITGELIEEDITALRLASALHPTPAICGTPTESARELVTELEPFDREYYAGTAGWVDAAGDGDWAVSVRCAQVTDRALRLYAGGGIMPASRPEAELAETSAKFRTLLRAMGLDLDL